MNPKLLNPEVRKTIRKVPRLPFGVKPLLPVAKKLYDLAAAGPGPLPETELQVILVNGREHRVTSIPGQTTRPSLLWFHGGGFVAGKPSHLDGLASLLAKTLGVTVIAPAYRLAPQSPFPAALEDAYESWVWLTNNTGAPALNTSSLAIGGNSAGAGLAANLVQKILDTGGQQPKAQVLFYPMLDDRTAANRSLDADKHFIWSNTANRVAWSSYLLPHEPGSKSLPRYASAARRMDLKGLPATWIGHCELDLFSGENREYAQRLRQAGVQCELHTARGVPHAFEVMCPEATISKRFVESAIGFIQEHLRC